MWFLLGIVPLSAYLGWRWGPGAVPRFEAQERRLDGTPWWLAPASRRGHTAAAIGVRAPDGFDFRLRPETDADRRARRSGVLAEQQVGDPAFDRAVFIESDDPLVARALADDPELRESLRDLLAGAASRTVAPLEIQARRGWLWMRFAHSHATRPEAQGRPVVPVLTALARRLRGLPRHVPLARRDPFARRAAWVLGLHVAIVVAAFAGVLLLRLTSSPLLDPLALVSQGIGAGLMLHLGGVFLARRWLGGSARARMVGIELLLVGSLATPVATIFALREANVLFDTAPGVVSVYRSGEVVRHKPPKGIASWWIEPGEPAPGSLWRARLPIDRATAERLRTASGGAAGEEASYLISGDRNLSPFRAEIRPGRFGAEWVAHVESLPAAEAAALLPPAPATDPPRVRPPR